MTDRRVCIAHQKYLIMVKSGKNLLFETPFDSYTKVRVIGSGGSGRVFQVKNSDGKSYALKSLSPEYVTTQKRKRFKNELNFCSMNRHPNIITVIDTGYVILNDTKCPFYVMPLYKDTLRELMKRKIPIEKVLPLLDQILNGVEAAHKQNIWHRDLKPENILYDKDDDRVVIADFGIAHFEEEFLQTIVETKPSERLASFQYAAPEQKDKSIKVDHRADIFALGMMLNEIFTGTPPNGVQYKTISNIAPQYQYLDDLVSQMLRQSPDQRPNSVDDIKKELIACGNEFVTRQKLSEFENTVIPSSKIDDPLVINPIEVMSIDYQKGILILKLSQSVNHNWILAFKNIGNFTHLIGVCEPYSFSFNGNIATISLSQSKYAQKVVDLFKSYIPEATKNYSNMLTKAIQKKECEDMADLQRKINEQQRREEIIKNVKF